MIQDDRKRNCEDIEICLQLFMPKKEALCTISSSVAALKVKIMRKELYYHVTEHILKIHVDLGFSDFKLNYLRIDTIRNRSDGKSCFIGSTDNKSESIKGFSSSPFFNTSRNLKTISQEIRFLHIPWNLIRQQKRDRLIDSC